MSAAHSLLSLPQPPSTAGPQTDQGARHPYKYVPYDLLETDWLGDPQRLQSFTTNNDVVYDAKNNSHDIDARYAPGRLVWVLLSKGKSKQSSSSKSGYNALALHRKRRDKKNKRMSNNNASSNENQGSEQKDAPPKGAMASGDNNILGNENKKYKTDNNAPTAPLSQGRNDFFLRARVVSDDEAITDRGCVGENDRFASNQKRNDRRVLVRYSKGSTYRVRANNLIPILEPIVHNIIREVPVSPASIQKIDEETCRSQSTALPPMVVLVPETHIYRRIAKVHTTPDDSFMEIGCDYGITVDKIETSLEEAGDVPKVWPPVDENNCDSSRLGEQKKVENTRVSCLGVDRSKESIDIAIERYPKSKFMLGNILIPEEMSSVRTLCEQSLVDYAPSIICIDVNGNREISGVLECLKMVMNETWKRQPRMIIVKSRFLYWELKKMEGGNVVNESV